jgi:DNA repair protein RadC
MQVTLRELITNYPKDKAPHFKSASDIAEELKFIQEASKEIMVAFYLDTKHRVIAREIISVGILNASLIHPREVYRSAIFCNAQSVVIAHNHPSGNSEPSGADKEVTILLCKAGEILGIELVDHVIIGDDGYTSLKEKGIIPYKGN